MKKLLFVIFLAVIITFNFQLSTFNCFSAEKGLVAYWSFDRISGDEVDDQSGNGLTGKVYDAEEVKGVIKGALSFKGGCVEVEANEALNPENEISVALWFNASEKDQSDKWLLNHIAQANTGYRFGFIEGKLAWQVPLTDWSHMISSPATVSIGQWHYAVGTYDGKKLHLYLDGKEVASMDRDGPINPNEAGLLIGTYGRGHERAFSSGIIDEVKIYNRALKPDEILVEYQKNISKVPASAAEEKKPKEEVVKKEEKPSTESKSGKSEGGLVGYWKFDSDNKEIADLSGKNNNASVTGGKVVTDGGEKVLEMDGGTKIEVASGPGLSVKKGFAIEAMVKPTDISNGRTIVFKDNEYILRINWPVEGSQISFFVFAGNAWEPRVTAFKPEVDTWYHIIAMWDGNQLTLWVNEQIFTAARVASAPPATSNPVMICSEVNYGGGFVGNLEYVKIYNRILPGAEIIKKVYRIEEKKTGLIESPVFEFKNGIQGWGAKERASVSVAGSKLQIKIPGARSFAMNESLKANIDKANYLSLKMSVDRGSTANIIFATTKGASKVAFQTFADGKMHTYVFEPWKWNGWGGNLVALGIQPSEADNSTAEVESIRITEDLQADPEVHIERLLTDSTLPRAERPEKIFVKIKNTGGTASNIKASLKVPEGISIKGPSMLGVDSLGYNEEKEIFWIIEASKPLTGEFQAELSGEKVEGIKYSNKLTFLPNLKLPKASYVPEPKPVKGKYNIWMHYCPLWKEGTHNGWGKIEPWPERKPVLGFYDEGTPEVADWHIKYMVEHGISGVVYCWYRTVLDKPVTVENQHIGHAVHDGILKAKYLPMIKFAIMWENGCGAGASSVDDLMKNVFPFWMDNYFKNPSYLRVEGKPVLYVWVPGNVTTHLGGSENVRRAFSMMREECRKRGLGGLYIVGCVGGKNESLLKQMAAEGWDASSSYGFDWSPPKEGTKRVGDCTGMPFDAFIDQQEDIVRYKNDLGALPDIAGAMEGWDARPWGSSSYFFYDNTADKFKDLCLRIKKIIDSKTTSGPEKNTIIFSNWTEFGEGHYIEPTRGYGFSYVDVIRDVFTDAPKEHLDIAPEDMGLGPYDSWYQQAKARKNAVKGDTSRTSIWTGDKIGLWKGRMGLGNVELKDGVLSATSVSNDPAFSSPVLNLRCSNFSKFVIEMRVSKSSGAQIFWSTTEMPGENEPASVSMATIADGEFHRYVFEVGKNEFWGGALAGLRFDPSSEEESNIEIRSIKLE